MRCFFGWHKWQTRWLKQPYGAVELEFPYEQCMRCHRCRGFEQWIDIWTQVYRELT